MLHLELIKSYNDTRISRILTLWLNNRLDYVPITLVCDANVDRLRLTCVEARDSLDRVDGPGYHVEYIQICGQTYWVHHVRIAAAVLNDFNQVVVNNLCELINRELDNKLDNEDDFRESLLAHGIDIDELGVTPEDVKILYELQQ